MNAQVAKDAVELWFEAHQFTIAALSSVSTFAAVVISLIVARQAATASDTKLTAISYIGVIVGGGIQRGQEPRYLTVRVTNDGVLPLQISYSCLTYRAPFLGGVALLQPIDHGRPHLNAVVPMRQYPIEIAPKASDTLYFGAPEVITSELIRCFDHLNWFQSLFFRRSTLRLNTADGKLVKVKMNKDVRGLIPTLSPKR